MIRKTSHSELEFQSASAAKNDIVRVVHTERGPKVELNSIDRSANKGLSHIRRKSVEATMAGAVSARDLPNRSPYNTNLQG